MFDNSSEVLSKCLYCGKEDNVPDFIYDEMADKVYHKELDEEIYTLNCNYCNNEKMVPINYILEKESHDLEKYLDNINNLINKANNDELKSIINDICKRLPKSMQELIKCLITNQVNGSLELLDVDIILKKVRNNFKKINNGEIFFEVDIETDENDYKFISTGNMNHVLNESFNYLKYFIYHRYYNEAIEICNIILNGRYQCRDFYDIMDSKLFKVDIEEVYDFPIDINEVCKYAIYANIILGKLDNISSYISMRNNFNIDELLNIGIDTFSREKVLKELNKI